MLQCFVLCLIIDQVIVMLVTACVCCFFYVGASFVHLGMALDNIAFLLLSFYKCYLWKRL